MPDKIFEQKIDINSIVKLKKTAADTCNLLHRFCMSGTRGFRRKRGCSKQRNNWPSCNDRKVMKVWKIRGLL